MNRRGFLWAVGAAGFAWILRDSAWGAGAKGGVNESARTTSSKSEALLIQAIEERRAVEFRYQDFLRRVEPHAIGEVGEGRRVLLAWQFAGESHSEPPLGWRNFVVAEIEKVKLLKTHFVCRADYDPVKAKLKAITSEVSK